LPFLPGPEVRCGLVREREQLGRFPGIAEVALQIGTEDALVGEVVGQCPDVWRRSCRSVMPAPPRTLPGSTRSTVSPSFRLPSAASWRTTVATNDFVTLPIRKRSPGRARTCPATIE